MRSEMIGVDTYSHRGYNNDNDNDNDNANDANNNKLAS